MLWISSPPEKRHRVVTPLFVPKLFSRSAHFVCVTHDSSSTSHSSNHHLATSAHASTTHITKRQNLETSTTQSCFGNDRRSRRRPNSFVVIDRRNRASSIRATIEPSRLSLRNLVPLRICAYILCLYIRLEFEIEL